MVSLPKLSRNLNPAPFEDLRNTPQDFALPLNIPTNRLYIFAAELNNNPDDDCDNHGDTYTLQAEY
jgi:hypothetical protein